MAEDHFIKHPHPPGEEDWNFNVVFNDQPQVAEMVAKYAKLLDHRGLYPPIPGEWLHATILRVGTTDEYTEAEMMQVAQALEPKLAAMKLPEFQLGLWWMWGGTPVLHIAPEDPLETVFDLIMAEIKKVVGGARMPRPTRFIPHVTLAYTLKHDQADEIYKKLVENPIPPVAFTVTHMPLIKQRIVDAHYEWDVVKNLKIG